MRGDVISRVGEVYFRLFQHRHSLQLQQQKQQQQQTQQQKQQQQQQERFQKLITDNVHSSQTM